MNKLTIDNIKIEDLKGRINNLRDVLNEICCTDSSTEVGEEKLDISRQLDLLIIEYMNEI